MKFHRFNDWRRIKSIMVDLILWNFFRSIFILTPRTLSLATLFNYLNKALVSRLEPRGHQHDRYPWQSRLLPSSSEAWRNLARQRLAESWFAVSRMYSFPKTSYAQSFSRYFFRPRFQFYQPRSISLAACMSAPPDSKRTQDTRDADKAGFDSDGRWQPLFEGVGYSRTDLEQQEELRKVTRPFLHDLHTWYSKNKPTKLMAPVKYTGKRPIPGRRIDLPFVIFYFINKICILFGCISALCWRILQLLFEVVLNSIRVASRFTRCTILDKSLSQSIVNQW